MGKLFVASLLVLQHLLFHKQNLKTKPKSLQVVCEEENHSTNTECAVVWPGNNVETELDVKSILSSDPQALF